MGYTIQAIIADRSLIETIGLMEAEIVLCPQEKAMIPFSLAFRKARQIPHLPLTDEGNIVLPQTIVELCRVISSSGKAVYIEAELFGGAGTQACLLWMGGKMIGKPTIARNAINIGLQFLGVKKISEIDEFEALDLGKFRNTDDWLQPSRA